MKRHGYPLLHGLVLCFLNGFGIVMGFRAWEASGAANQISVQVPVALLITVLGFLAWAGVSSRREGPASGLRGARALVVIFVASLVLAPAFFIPLHRLVAGYWTAASNITAGWLFQAPANLIALAALAAARRAVSSAGGVIA